MADRCYLDWNATAPLRQEARDAMLAAMDLCGNPSSVHGEGRAAKACVEQARGQVAALIGVAPSEIIFTSGATEAAKTIAAAFGPIQAEETEHDCVFAHRGDAADDATAKIRAISAANSETGILRDPAPGAGLLLRDAVQALGKTAYCHDGDIVLASAHKIGGPKGIGAIALRPGLDLAPLLTGGGQEMGRRSGTENVIGIAGFGAAATAAMRDLEGGAWDRVKELRTILECELDRIAPNAILMGAGAARLPNTTCVATPGWKGETQVMQMDLAGFAISAGSACSSGKVRESRVLRAMGHDAEIASSAIRISLGLTTTEDEILEFARAWEGAFRRFQARRDK